MDNKKLADVVSSLEGKVKENSERLEQLQERVEKLENPGTHENRDDSDNQSNYAGNDILNVNDKLSNHAQKAAQDSRGPLKPGELLKHFTSNDFGKKKKEAMAVIKKFPDNIDGIKHQLSCILEDLDTQVARRKKENEQDIQLIQRIKKFNETLGKEKEKEKKPNTKIKFENIADPSQNVTARNKKKTLEGNSHAGMPVKQAGKRGRKRKVRNYDDEDDDTCSSQEIEVEKVTASCKRLKLSSRESSQESIQPNPVHKLATFRKHRQPTPVIDSASSQSSLEEDSAETDVKSKGKRSKQPDCNGDEETVHEKQFSFRGKLNRRD